MSELAALDQRHHLHPFTSLADLASGGPMIIDRAKGVRIWDDKGHEMIDAMAGLWCVNVGYGREEIAEAVSAQIRKLSYYHSFMGVSNEPAIRLAQRIADLAPGNLNHVFFGNSGSDANDTQVKLVWYYNNLRGKPDKKKFIARKKAYHGVTVMSASLSHLPHLHNRFDVPREGFIHVETPHHYRCAPEGMNEEHFSAYLAEDLEATIINEGPESIGAFIAEPVMGAGGVIVPPTGYFDAIVPILKKYDILLITDEVVCGFGRLGTNFGADYFGIQPDLMTCAKGMTSGYIPMSAVVVSDEIHDVLQQGSSEAGPFGHGFTYSAHPVSAAAGLANLDIVEREGLLTRANDIGPRLQNGLRERFADHPLVGEVRGIGLIAGVELVADKKTKEPFDPKRKVGVQLHRLCMEEGLITRPIGDLMAFSPPLVISETDIDLVLDRFGRGLERLTKQL